MKLSFYDPQNDPRLIQYIQTKSIANNFTPFNFYSILDLGIRTDNLYPKPEIITLLKEEMDGDGNTYAFDKAYCNQIISNEKTFCDLMKIISNIHITPEIIVISNYTNSLIMPILDSLIKFIQERYGIDSFIINDLDDIDELKYSTFSSLEQEAIFIKDCERYTKLAGVSVITSMQDEDDKEYFSKQKLKRMMNTNLANYDAQRFGII